MTITRTVRHARLLRPRVIPYESSRYPSRFIRGAQNGRAPAREIQPTELLGGIVTNRGSGFSGAINAAKLSST